MGREAVAAAATAPGGSSSHELAADRPLSRSQLLARGLKGGAALLAAGSALRFAEDARADPLPDNDLAYARLLVGVELLSIDFYTRALEAKLFRKAGQKKLREALAHEQAHYASVGQILLGAGLVPAGQGDIDFGYAKNTFARRGSIAQLGLHLETISVGAYLGAVANIQATQLHQQVARIAASEAQHLSIFGDFLARPIGNAFPAALPIEQISGALDAFES
jgi:hypothetical protein